MNWRGAVDSRRAEAYLWNRRRNRAINSSFFTLQGHFRFDEARPGVPLFSFAEIKCKKYGL